MPGASRSIVIHAPPQRVFEVVTAYERYPQFLPEVKRVQVRREGGQVEVDYEVNVVKTLRYTLRMREEAPSKVAWSFVKGDVMRDNHGQWELTPDGEGKTKAVYTIEMALGPLVPKSIVNMLVETSLPRMLEAFKKAAESRS